MKGPNTSTKSFKQAFLNNLLLGLQLQARTSKSFRGLHERKLAVKHSADVAMAAARAASCTGARWPKAILATAVAGPCKGAEVVRRCCRSKRNLRGSGGGLPRSLLRRRTMALREVIPGGWDSIIDEATLLREAMDYAVHLRAQVDVLRQLSEAVQTSSSSDFDRALRKEP